MSSILSPIFLAGQGLTQSETTVDYPRADRLVDGNPKRLTQSMYEHKLTKITNHAKKFF